MHYFGAARADRRAHHRNSRGRSRRHLPRLEHVPRRRVMLVTAAPLASCSESQSPLCSRAESQFPLCSCSQWQSLGVSVCGAEVSAEHGPRQGQLSGMVSCCEISLTLLFGVGRQEYARLRSRGPAGLFVEPKLRMPDSWQARKKRSQYIMYRLQGFMRRLKDAGRVRCRAHQISCGASPGWD